MMNKLRIVEIGPVRGDCCSNNTYLPTERFTVQEMCDYILTTKEWGYIGIQKGLNRSGSIFGDPNVEYMDGTYVDKDRKPIEFKFPPEIANAVVQKVEWSGGWSRGDWLIQI